jgi:hypothetical protein
MQSARLKIRHLAIAFFSVTLVAAPAPAQSSADLLQKGIYAEDTAGDLDTAIKLYRQVAGNSSEPKATAAQAQLHLGQALLKKGDKEGATKAFEQVVHEYPDQKELVARAQEYLQADMKLLPAPWPADEQSEYTVKLPGGLAIGTFVYSVERHPTHPQNALLQLHGYQMGAPQRLSKVEVDADTMRPVSSSMFITPLIPGIQIDYTANQAKVQPKGQEAKLLPLNGPVFDNEEVAFLSRRLPLAPDYKTTLSIISPIGVPVKLETVVTGTEDVEVPAGKFHCYRVELKVVQNTFWVATSGSRALVKMDAGGATVELTRTGSIDRVSPVPFHESKVGLSLMAPPGWIVETNDMPQANQSSFQLLDPEVQGMVTVFGKTAHTDKTQIAQELRKQLDDGVKDRAKQLKDYHLRPDSVQTLTVNGQQANTSTADYLEGTTPMVEYAVSIRGEDKGALAVAHVAAPDFDAFRKRFDAIVNSIQLQ